MIREGRKLPENAVELIPDFIDRIRLDGDVTAAFVFGSALHGALKPLSDLDLAILLSNRLSRQERFEKQLDILGLANSLFKTDEIDLVVLNDAPLRMAFNILKTGKILFMSDDRWYLDFRNQVMLHYFDFKYFRDSFEQEFLRGVGFHG